MRYPILATALSLVLGTGLALADDTSQTEGPKVAPPQPNAMEVFFDTDSSELTAANDAALQELANWAKCKKTNIIKLEGHADPRGTVEHNTELSEDRARAVSDKLIELGAPKDRIVVTLYGELGERRPTLAEDRRVSAMPTKEPAVTASR